MERILPAAFFDRDPSLVAPDLLGKYVIRLYYGERLVGKITETEAYLPFGDEASHGMKRTKTRDSLYKRGGHAYVYGLRHHYLFNTVTEGIDRPGGVLIRGVAPVEGIDTMLTLRGKSELKDLSNGPGKVCQALSITRAQDGIDLTKRNGELYIEDWHEKVNKKDVLISKRIGITKAVDMMLRFNLKN